MQNLIEYIIDLLNVKTNSIYTVADMETELTKIDDFGKYRNYLRNNLKHIDVDFQSGFQKFIILTEKYLATQENAKLPHKTANTFTDKIIYKISKTKDKLKNAIERCEPFPLSRALIKVDGEVKKLFEDSEINALIALKVNPNVIIEMFELGTLKDNLMKTYMKHHLENVNNKAISDNQKEVLKITNIANNKKDEK